MKPLDNISARLFPSLAAYARRLRWLVLLAAAMMIYVLGFHNGLLVGTYRGQVADESYNHMVSEFHQFKEDYLRRFGKELRTTKAQAQVLTTEIERRKEGEQ